MELFITFIQFIVLGLSLAAPIGPMNIEVMKRGLTEGLMSSWLVGLGGITGDIILLVSIFFGFSSFMQLHIVKVLMYIIGVIMLGYLGWGSIKAVFSNQLHMLASEDSKKPKNAYITGLIIALANPLSLVFWFGVYGSSLQSLTAANSLMFSLLCSFAIVLGLFLWNLNIVFTVHFSKRLMNATFIRGITLIAGLCLLGFCIHFSLMLYKLFM